MTALTYDYNTWILNAPEFAGCSPAQGQAYFNQAATICENSVCNPLYVSQGAAGFTTVFYLLVSHIAWLRAPRDAQGNPAATGQPASPIVGRVNSASEGSVSVGADMGDANAASPSQAWYMQTQWGAAYWEANRLMRVATYYANPLVMPQTYFPGYYPNLNSRRMPFWRR